MFPSNHEAKIRPITAKGRIAGFVVCALLAVITWIVFGQTQYFDFVNYDDQQTVYGNSDVAKGLTRAGVGVAFTQSQVGHWDPLTTLSHMLVCQIQGMNPRGHHFGNVILHIAAVVALFLVLSRMTRALWCSAFVAAVFAIHPLRAESVAWVTERKDVLSGLFFMLTLGAYVGYARHPFSIARYGLVLLSFALGLMSKSMLITLPLILLLLDYWPLRRFCESGTESQSEQPVTLQKSSALRHLILEKIPFIALSVVFSIVQLVSGNEGILEMERLPLGSRVTNAFISYATYVGQMFYPVSLAPFYPHPMGNLPVWKTVLAMLFVVAISVWAVVWRRTRPFLLVGWIWFIGMLLPVIGIIQSGELARADRYTYLPQIGLYIMFAWAIADVTTATKHRRLALGFASVIAIGALMTAGWKQTSYWRNSGTLWQHALEVTAGNYVAYEHLGLLLTDKNLPDEAIVQYRAALEANPSAERAANNLGLLLLQKRQVNEAIFYLKRAVEIRPSYETAQNNLGNALLEAGDFDAAIEHYQRALELAPNLAVAELNQGLAYAQSGRIANAIVHFQRAVDLQPNYTKALGNLGSALVATGREREAAVHFRKTLELEPDALVVQNSLAWILATSSNQDLRDGAAAVILAEKLNDQSGGQEPRYLLTLAMAYGAAGRFDEALAAAHRAQAQAESRHNPQLEEMIRTRLQELKADSQRESQ